MQTPAGNSQSDKPCCAPSRDAAPALTLAAPMAQAPAEARPASRSIPGGKGLLGTRNPAIPEDGESPLRRRNLKRFEMAETAVTNAEFEAFVTATGYQTEAERFGWSFVFWSHIPPEIAETQGVAGREWWRRVDGANWRDINGPGTAATSWHTEHPVVQVSWADARAYAAWIGGRLPTELEWEHAARGGLGDVPYPWGEAEPDDRTHFPCNIWQGEFPRQNTAADGFDATAPARSFEPNGYGLFNMVGNVWEWVSDPFTIRSNRKAAKARGSLMSGLRMAKGGSFLCHKSYCFRYRISARIGNTGDSTASHTGFRVVWDPS